MFTPYHSFNQTENLVGPIIFFEDTIKLNKININKKLTTILIQCPIFICVSTFPGKKKMNSILYYYNMHDNSLSIVYLLLFNNAFIKIRIFRIFKHNCILSRCCQFYLICLLYYLKYRF